jgi:hypothetical protein
MTKSSLLLIGLLVGVLLVAAAPMVAYADDDDDRGSRGDLDVTAITADGRLIEFESDDPGDADTIGTIGGLVQDTRIVGIDYRPFTGELYGLGDQGGVYVISDKTAQATLKSRLNVALSGASFGIDFNPTVDRLRVISDNSQNLRVNVDTGATLTDGTLTYPGPPATTGTGVTGAAYTNNDADPNTGTTLFDVDSMLDQVSIQSPPNNGSLVATGKLGVDTTPDVAFDIDSQVRRGTTVANAAYAALSSSDGSRFYSVDLLTGRATDLGRFDRDDLIIGIAVTDDL